MDVARSAPRGTHYHADVIYPLPKLGIKKGQGPYGTLSLFYTDGQHTLTFYTTCVSPVALSYIHQIT